MINRCNGCGLPTKELTLKCDRCARLHELNKKSQLTKHCSSCNKVFSKYQLIKSRCIQCYYSDASDSALSDVDLKRCVKCNSIELEDNFYKSTTSKVGLSLLCKPCDRKRSRERVKKTVDEDLARQKLLRRRHKTRSLAKKAMEKSNA